MAATDHCHHAPTLHACSSSGKHRDAGQPMPFSSSSCCSSFLTHTLQLLFICLEIVGAVPCFTLYACVRLVLRCCKGAEGPAHTAGPSAAGGYSVLNVFVASRADSLISFSKVSMWHLARYCSSLTKISGLLVRLRHRRRCRRPDPRLAAATGASREMHP